MQTTNHILLIRPSDFVFNTETAATNAFQTNINLSPDEVKRNVSAEFESFAAALKTKGVQVCVFDDTPSPQKPDAIFPNNWVSFHPDGTVILYPMCAWNRQPERRPDIIEKLKQQFIITKVIDLSHYEKENRFLEGTGSMVFNHNGKVAYACLSQRTHKELFMKVCGLLRYEPVFFHAYDRNGMEIYHTNVLMCVGEKFAVVCLDSIRDTAEKQQVADSINKSGLETIDISFEQMERFAGNMLEIKSGTNHQMTALSDGAYHSLSSEQKRKIEKHSELFPVSIPTIETIGGGSVRCMMAEIFLEPTPCPSQRKGCFTE